MIKTFFPMESLARRNAEECTICPSNSFYDLSKSHSLREKDSIDVLGRPSWSFSKDNHEREQCGRHA